MQDFDDSSPYVHVPLYKRICAPIYDLKRSQPVHVSVITTSFMAFLATCQL